MANERRHSYGVIPVFKSENGFEVLVVLQDRLGKLYWSFAKGTPETGEKPLEAALRETKEEVGITFDTINEEITFTEDYTFEEHGICFEKRVVFFMGFVADKTYKLQPEEVEKAKWVPIDIAEKVLTFPESKKIAKQLRAYLT